ncbi:MAG TPA: peptidase dimerization domain-containing protein, partial [Fibrobacteraceae bacterium]|nr:peptidase dimerization domain-containing protein [Fibrobacteraceae bacterium]
AEHQDLLKADAVIVADLNNIEKGTPCITTSLRGMSAIEVSLTSTETPLHSGSWSGPIPDPAQALCRIITSLTNDNGDILIEGFDEGIKAPSAEELDSYSKLPLKAPQFRKDSRVLEGVQLLVKEPEIPLALWRRPSIVITALESGNRKMAGNVLQNSAYARISIRLAPGMDADDATQKLIDHVQKNIPYGLHATIEKESGA